MKRDLRRLFAATAATVLVGLLAGPGALSAQDSGDGGGSSSSPGRARVLVVPLQVKSQKLDKDFGDDVAESVRDSLQNFNTLTSVAKDEVKKALKQYKLDEDAMGLIQWRQLASKLDAQLIMFGEVTGGPASYTVNAKFVDAKTGDEFPVPEFSVNGDRSPDVKKAAGSITSALQNQVKFLRSKTFCQEYLGAKQLEDALRNCNSALEANAQSDDARYLRGRVYMQMEKWQKAEQDLSKVVENNQANTQALQSLAYVNAKLGNMDRASELYKQYLDFNPNDVQVRLKVAYDLASAGAYDPAINLLEAGIQRDSTNASLWEFLGNVALKKGTTADTAANLEASEASVTDTSAVRLAVTSYDHVLQIKGDSIDPGILRNVVAADLELGDIQAALDFSQRALQKKPGDASLWSMRADVLARQGKLDQAVQSMNKALTVDSAYPNGYMKRGMFKLRAGQSSSALEDFQTAIRHGTDSNQVASALFARGYNQHFKNAEYGTAVDMFKTALQFAQKPDLQQQLNFFTGYGYYMEGVKIDKSNPSEACAPARRALEYFQKAPGYMKRAGDYQAASQKQVLDNTDVYVYREQQTVKKACK